MPPVYHILFLLEYGGKYQARIGYKETLLSGKNTFKVNAYYQTEWMDEDNLPLKLEGLSIEAVYENFVRQVAGDRLKAKENSESLKKSVTRDEEKQSLQKQIDNLKAKIRKEAQLNRQMEMNSELKVLIKKLETM